MKARSNEKLDMSSKYFILGAWFFVFIGKDWLFKIMEESYYVNININVELNLLIGTDRHEPVWQIRDKGRPLEKNGEFEGKWHWSENWTKWIQGIWRSLNSDWRVCREKGFETAVLDSGMRFPDPLSIKTPAPRSAVGQQPSVINILRDCPICNQLPLPRLCPSLWWPASNDWSMWGPQLANQLLYHMIP